MKAYVTDMQSSMLLVVHFRLYEMFIVLSQQRHTHATCLLLLYHFCSNDLLATAVAQIISM
jgi:hypothetical protein